MEEEEDAFHPQAPSSCIVCDLSYANLQRTLPLREGCQEAMLGGAWSFKNWTYTARMWTVLNQCDEKTKAGPGSMLKDSRRSFKRVEMMWAWCRQSHGSPLTGCYGLTTLALIQRDTQPSNLLSAQFQWTMEFRASQYSTLSSTLRLAARLMRLRLPTGEPNGVKTKVLLWTNNPSVHYHTEMRWLLANTQTLPMKGILYRHKVSERVCRLRWMLLRLQM